MPRSVTASSPDFFASSMVAALPRMPSIWPVFSAFRPAVASVNTFRTSVSYG